MKVNDHSCDPETSPSIFAYSSISNTGWIALGATLSLASTVIFMVTYFLVSIVTILLLNLVGLPRVFSSAAQQD
jgi:NADH:ubiquinone oxidoreductase subunit 2 (subunit N)